MDVQEALRLLDEGAFDGFIGARESQTVEFKRKPYSLDHESQKFELAKDVAALANGQGGVLLIGLATRREPETPLDIVASVQTIRRGLIDEDRYAKVIDARVYPRIKRLAVRFVPSAADTDQGLVAIVVPLQAEADRYFLVARPLPEGGTPGWLLAERARRRQVGSPSVARVEAMNIGELHGIEAGRLSRHRRNNSTNTSTGGSLI